MTGVSSCLSLAIHLRSMPQSPRLSTPSLATALRSAQAKHWLRFRARKLTTARRPRGKC